MIANGIIAEVEGRQRDGVCFFCGEYSDSLDRHETKVHGRNRSRQDEVY